MIVRGVVRNGVVVIDPSVTLPEETAVRIEIDAESVSSSTLPQGSERQGGWLTGKIVIAPDFDVLPDDIAEAFGMNSE